MMRMKQASVGILVPLCVVLSACAIPNQGSKVDLYALPQATSHMPLDNDSYYIQPSGYKGCQQINDAPSCGGG